MKVRLVHDEHPCPKCGLTSFDAIECEVEMSVEQWRLLRVAMKAGWL